MTCAYVAQPSFGYSLEPSQCSMEADSRLAKHFSLILKVLDITTESFYKLKQAFVSSNW